MKLEATENGVLYWLLRPAKRSPGIVGFVRSERDGALVLRGPTGTHLSGHGEGWRGKWEEFRAAGFMGEETARGEGLIPGPWRPARLSRKERKLLEMHQRHCDDLDFEPSWPVGQWTIWR